MTKLECLPPAALVREYICKHNYDGNPGYRRAHRIPEGIIQGDRALHAVPFPHAGNAGPETTRNIWLFGERGGEAAEDNGLAMFRYVVDKSPKTECYYVLNKPGDYPGLVGYEKNVIYKNTDDWESKLKQASHFFFTDSAADILNASNDINQFPDVTNVYLTHGCLAYSPGVYQKGHQYIDFVTCTNRQDIESATREWGFPSSKFLLTGLARWDRLDSARQKRKEILLCPTWRKCFNSSNWNLDEDLSQEDVETFRSSDFFVFFSSLLRSPDVISILEHNDIVITVNLHFRFRKYLPQFDELQSDRIKIATPENDSRDLREMMQDAVALITDYSSIMWDMGFMEKPVICYQFDKPAMLAERQKEQFAMTDDMLFAEVCYSEASIIDALKRLVLRDFCNDDFQTSKLNKYIPHRDAHNCERIFRALTPLDLSVAGDKSPNNSKRHYSFSTGERVRKVLDGLGATTKAGVIANIDLSSYDNVIALEPDTWKDTLDTESIDVVLVELHLNARDCWAPVFFEPQATFDFLDELLVLCESRNINTIYCQSATYPYSDYLRVITDRFGEYLPSEEASVELPGFDVSIIIPAFNSENYLSKTIDSALGQKFAGTIEVIVVNDGSTDGTQNILDQYIAHHTNIVGITQSNTRQGMARNHALQVARGEYILFLDSDDILPVNAVAELHHTLKYNGTKVATGLVASCNSAGENQRINQAYYHYSKAPGTITAESWPHVFYDPSCAGKMYQRKFLLESRLFFPQSFHEDQVFTFKLFSSLDLIAVTNSIVYLYVARSEPGVQSGTQTFSNEKFREMLLAGTLAKFEVKQSGLSTRVLEYALGFLVMRYDRFLWKQNSSGNWQGDPTVYADTIGLLGKFLSEIPDEIIWRNARYCAVFLLLTKRSMHDLAARLRLPEIEEVLSKLISDGEIPADIEDTLESAPDLVSKYNYYRAVPVGSLTDNTQIVTEMSYGHRLGEIIVDVAKSPVKVLLVPWRTTVLLFDMVSRKGRIKERVHKEKILQDSSQALLNHSAFIKSTASYQLGVAIMESFTRSPTAVFKLPGKVKRIYKQNV